MQMDGWLTGRLAGKYIRIVHIAMVLCTYGGGFSILLRCFDTVTSGMCNWMLNSVGIVL